MSPASQSLDVPAAFAASYGVGDPAARAWVAALPKLAADLLDRWDLRPDGLPGHGMASLVLPVRRADGTDAVVKFQRVTEETAGVPAGLRAWGGQGVLELYDHDPATGTMLLERLDAARPLSSVADTDDTAAMGILAGVMARLVAVEAPEGLRRLDDVAAAMLEEVPRALPAVRDPDERRLLRRCADTVAELIGDEPGNRLLHWDLHYDNVLAGQREPWLAIDPEPLAGDPAFELWPALDTRWEEVVVPTGDVTRAVLRRFDLLTEVLGLDRGRAVGWTMGRVLQNALWEVEDGGVGVEGAQVAVVSALLTREPAPPVR
ncbi:aminoglycoside phosphotransferase family protein [Streptomyces sp. NPDC001985]|uniref:aminoglycoside phosphotransferase family protein n=1 Tax=Streptomyces sp. NPDC001985 TaxID=3154406 RepID=UPI00332FD169